jgi:hypothetical protein
MKKKQLRNYTTDWHIETAALLTYEQELTRPLEDTQENLMRVLNGEYTQHQKYLTNQIAICKGSLHDIEFKLYYNGATPDYLKRNNIIPGLGMTYYEKNIASKITD